MRKKVWLSWSSGKDSAWALWQMQQDPNVVVERLFCTINQTAERVAMHGVRVSLLQKQAQALGLPLTVIDLPSPCSNDDYQRIMGRFVESAKQHQVDAFAFGDLYLESVRDYRVEQLSGSGIEAIFPLWKTPTDELSQRLIESGVKTVLTCVDSKQIDAQFSGRRYDQALLDALPESCDPCGENGEFHTFVYDGPMFTHPISIEVGEQVDRDGFIFTDLQSPQ
jgi:uncharacterized protein (TIGR00290 family)